MKGVEKISEKSSTSTTSGRDGWYPKNGEVFEVQDKHGYTCKAKRFENNIQMAYGTAWEFRSEALFEDDVFYPRGSGWVKLIPLSPQQ